MEPIHLTKIPPEAVTHVGSPADIENDSHLSWDESEALLEMAKARQEARTDTRGDVILTFKEWALDYPSEDDPIVYSPAYMAAQVEDYSAKSYLIRGGYAVMLDLLTDGHDRFESARYLDELKDEVYEEGVSYVPKSAIEAVFVVKP